MTYTVSESIQRRYRFPICPFDCRSAVLWISSNECRFLFGVFLVLFCLCVHVCLFVFTSRNKTWVPRDDVTMRPDIGGERFLHYAQGRPTCVYSWNRTHDLEARAQCAPKYWLSYICSTFYCWGQFWPINKQVLAHDMPCRHLRECRCNQREHFFLVNEPIWRSAFPVSGWKLP